MAKRREYVLGEKVMAVVPVGHNRVRNVVGTVVDFEMDCPYTLYTTRYLIAFDPFEVSGDSKYDRGEWMCRPFELAGMAEPIPFTLYDTDISEMLHEGVKTEQRKYQSMLVETDSQLEVMKSAQRLEAYWDNL